MGNKGNGEARVFLSQGTEKRIWHKGFGLYNRGRATQSFFRIATGGTLPARVKGKNLNETYWIYGLIDK